VCVCVRAQIREGKKKKEGIKRNNLWLCRCNQTDAARGSVVVGGGGGGGGEEEWQCTRVAISGNVFSAAAYAVRTSRVRYADSTVRVACG